MLSTTAIREAFEAISSASRRISRARSVPVVRPQSSNAARAARTAASTSSGPARGTVAHGRPVNGSTVSNVSPERAGTHSPPISIR